MADPPTDTRWCPQCGAEYRAGYTTCADCGAALVEHPPPAPELVAPGPVAADDHEPAGFDLTDWSTERRGALEWMLQGQAIPFEWEPPGLLLVPAARQDQVEGFVDYIDSGSDTDEAAEASADEGASLWWPEGAGSPADRDRVDPTGCESVRSSERWDVPAPLRWITARLDSILEAYLELRSQLDATAAFDQALAATLDEPSCARLESYFDGDMDAVDGPGAGEAARAALLSTFEGRANHPAGGAAPPPD